VVFFSSLGGTFVKKIIVCLALLIAASTVIQAGTISFSFVGTCSDCSGQGTATLTLQNYNQGDAIVAANLVSFTYNGTNLLSSFTINAINLGTISGLIPVGLPSSADFSIDENTLGPTSLELDRISPFFFSSSSSGTWSAGSFVPGDQGTNGVWNPQGTGVPEPSTLLLIPAGLGAIGLMRRRRLAKFRS